LPTTSRNDKRHACRYETRGRLWLPHAPRVYLDALRFHPGAGPRRAGRPSQPATRRGRRRQSYRSAGRRGVLQPICGNRRNL